jgi:hypothetical protein
MASGEAHLERYARNVALALGSYLENRQERACGQLVFGVWRLLEALMQGQPGWDDDDHHSWLDGIEPKSVTVTSADTVRIVGHAWVGEEGARMFRLRPMQADLARPPATSTLYLASADTEVPFDVSPDEYARLLEERAQPIEPSMRDPIPSRIAERMVIPADPPSWPYVFHVQLPTTTGAENEEPPDHPGYFHHGVIP